MRLISMKHLTILIRAETTASDQDAPKAKYMLRNDKKCLVLESIQLSCITAHGDPHKGFKHRSEWVSRPKVGTALALIHKFHRHPNGRSSHPTEMVELKLLG